VAFQFTRKGVITVEGTGEEQLLTILDSGADDAIEEDGETIVYTDPKQLAQVRDNLKEAGLKIKEAELSYEPNNLITIEDQSTAGKLMRLMDALDDVDEVTKTHVNFDIPSEFIES
jgi:transcriptional/translational regulatory protein YebC/TACO1